MTNLNPTLILTAQFIVAVEEFDKNPNRDSMIAAMKSFAEIDWIEPEVDPEQFPWGPDFLEYAYAQGMGRGFKIIDEMTDLEMTLLDLD